MQISMINESPYFSVAIQPLCLHPDRENLIVGKRATVVGWGKLSNAQRQPIMQFLEVPLTAWDNCAKIYGQTGALESPKSVGMYLFHLRSHLIQFEI